MPHTERFDSYIRSGLYYDAIYAVRGKDYEREAEQIHALIQQHKQSPGATLLDVGCGTASHLSHLRRCYQVEGLDINATMLKVAQAHNPDIPFHQGDMVDFDLGRQFDIVTCLFSGIGYVQTVPRLRQTLRTLARHLLPGGVLIVEPWRSPGDFQPGQIRCVFVDQPDLKIARMAVTRTDGNLSILDYHYLVATPDGVEYFTEEHKAGLFLPADYLEAFRSSGLEVIHDAEGLIGRGLYIGKRPLASP